MKTSSLITNCSCYRYNKPAMLLFLIYFMVISCAFAEDSKPMTNTTLRVLLIGDSTVMGSVPHSISPKADQLEDVVRKILAGYPDLPPVEIINKGQNMDMIHKMLTDRYERDVAKLPGGPLDYVFIRYGINDRVHVKDWPKEFSEVYRRFIAQLRRDQPQASITIETIIPSWDEDMTREVNNLIRKVAESESLPVLDTHAAFAEALKLDPIGLNYRSIPLANIPSHLRSLLPPLCESSGTVYLMDNLLDAHFRKLSGWIIDPHPGLAGYHVNGKAIAEYLEPLIRKRPGSPVQAPPK